MTSLGTLTLDLKLNDARYIRQLENARRLTQEFDREFSRRSLTLPGINTRGFETDLRNVGSRGGSILTGIFQGVGQQITSTLTGAISAGLQGLTGTVGGVAREFANFDQQLNLLAVRTGASREELAEFERVALRVGLTTSKLPAEAAAAGVELAQLGVQVPGLVENLDDVVGASEATGISITGLGRALQVGVNIFGDTGESIESLSDKFVVLANSTAVTSEADFLQFLSKSGATAQQIGVDFEELAAAFATVRDLGASPEVAATGVNSLFTRLRGNTDEAKEAIGQLEESTGRQISLFDELGNLRTDVPLIDTLRNLRDSLSEFNDEDRLDIIGQIFGTGSRGGANAINNLLKGLETNYQATFERLTAITGEEAENASRVLISGFSGALSFIAGSVNTIQVELGRAFNSLLAPLAEGFGELVTGFVLDQDPFAPIRDSAQALANTLFEIPGISDTISESFNTILNAGVRAIAGLLDDITQSLEENPEAVTNFVENFTTGFLEAASVIGQVASTIGALAAELANIGGPLAETAGNLFQGLLASSDLLVGTLQAVGFVLRPLADLLRALSENAFLVETAFKVIIAANLLNTVSGLILPVVNLGIALKGVAAAGAVGNLPLLASFATGLGPLTAFTGGLSALAAGAAAAAPVIAILAAGIGAIEFIRQAKAAREFNDAIEALANATNSVGDTGLQAANRLNNAIREGNEARRQGLEIDREAIKQRIRLAEQEQRAIADQRRAIQSELDDLGSGSGFFGVRDDQRQSLQNQITELDAADRALSGQLSNAQELLDAVTADAVQAQADAAKATGAIGEQEVQEFRQREDEKLEATKKRLEEVEVEARAANNRLNQIETESINAILRDQLSGNIDEDQATERIAQARQDAITAQVQELERQISVQRQLENEQVQSAEETAAKISDLEVQKTEAVQRQLEAQVQAQRDAEQARREVALEEADSFAEAANRAFDERTKAFQKALETEQRAEQRAFDERKELADEEFKFREEQLAKNLDAQKKALEERQQLEKDAQNQRLSALERFVDRELQLEEASSPEERRELEDQFAEEDRRAARRRELEEEALRRDDSIVRRDARARGGSGLSPFEEDQRNFETEQQAEQDRLAKIQEEQQKRLADLRETQEDEFAAKREALEEQFAAQRQQTEELIAGERKALEDELSLRRQEAETGLQQDRAAFAANQRQLDINAANEVARILSAARPQALTARRHGGPVGPGSSFLVGEAPSIGPELGVFGNQSVLFTQPTVLPNPPQGRIYSPEQTKRMLSAPSSITNDTNPADARIANEIRQLRQQVGRVREVMPLLDALAQNIAKDTRRLERDRLFENARWRLGGL